MSEKGSKVNLVENDELSKENDSKDKDNINETYGLISNLKKHFGIEFDGLFFIILSIIIFALAITIAMVLCIFFGPPQIRPHAGISSEVTECTEMGLEICRKSGSGVDSAIATLLCLSIVRPDIAGLGGCGSLLVHNHSSMVSQIIDFSCVAPPNAKADPIKDGYGVTESVAMPGVFSGLRLAHTTYGKMNWSVIVGAVIEKLNKGIKVTPAMKAAFSSSEFKSLPSNFRTIYKDWASGAVFKPTASSMNILTTILNEGIITGITGSIAKEMMELGFQWTDQLDTARKQNPLMAIFGDYSLYTAPLPSKGGLDLAMAFEMLNKVLPHRALEKETTLYYHRLLESLKVSQATTSFYGDSDNGIEPRLLAAPSIDNLVRQMGVGTTYPNQNYGPYYLQSAIEDGSGSHISIVDPNSLYVSLSVNLGSKFGSGISTKSGILLNDAMRLFTQNNKDNQVPGLQIRNTTVTNNQAAPGKRPLNQLIPLVVYNFKRKCGVRFAVGGDHGPRSSTGNLQMVMSAIYLDQKFCPTKDCMELPKAVMRPRLHVNILENRNPNSTAVVYYDSGFPANIQQELTTSYKHSNFNVSSVIHSLNSIGKVQYEIQGIASSPGGQFVSF